MSSIKGRKSPWPKGYCPIPKEKRFQKGDPRINRAGGKPVTQRIKAILEELGSQSAPPIILKEMRSYFPGIRNMTMRQAWLAKAYILSITGSPSMFDFIANRTEGPVAQMLRIGDADRPKTPLSDEQLSKVAKTLHIKIDGSKIYEPKEDDK